MSPQGRRVTIPLIPLAPLYAVWTTTLFAPEAKGHDVRMQDAGKQVAFRLDIL